MVRVCRRHLDNAGPLPDWGSCSYHIVPDLYRMVLKETYELYDPHFSVRHESTPPTLDQKKAYSTLLNTVGFNYPTMYPFCITTSSISTANIFSTNTRQRIIFPISLSCLTWKQECCGSSFDSYNLCSRHTLACRNRTEGLHSTPSKEWVGLCDDFERRLHSLLSNN